MFFSTGIPILMFFSVSQSSCTHMCYTCIYVNEFTLYTYVCVCVVIVLQQVAVLAGEIVPLDRTISSGESSRSRHRCSPVFAKSREYTHARYTFYNTRVSRCAGDVVRVHFAFVFAKLYGFFSIQMPGYHEPFAYEQYAFACVRTRSG